MIAWFERIKFAKTKKKQKKLNWKQIAPNKSESPEPHQKKKQATS